MVTPLDWHLPPYTVESVYTPLAGQVVDWSLNLIGIPAAWQKTRGKGVRVAVLDTGAPDHPDLLPAIVAAKDFTGSRFGALDRQGHSSHCCGILGARDNQIGTVGVAPECSILCGKVLGDSGSGSGESVANGILWAIEQKADVISMSLGSQSPDNLIHSAIQKAVAAGITVVVAAGNDGPYPNSVDYPGRWPEVISVGSINSQGRVSSFSSRGPEVDIAAPGEGITSTYLNGQIAKLSGTSMSTPLVAGVVALLLAASAQKPTPEQVYDLLKDTALDIEDVGFDVASGWGLVNPKSLLSQIPSPPLPPPPGQVTPLRKFTLTTYSDGSLSVE